MYLTRSKKKKTEGQFSVQNLIDQPQIKGRVQSLKTGWLSPHMHSVGGKGEGFVRTPPPPHTHALWLRAWNIELRAIALEAYTSFLGQGRDRQYLGLFEFELDFEE